MVGDDQSAHTVRTATGDFHGPGLRSARNEQHEEKDATGSSDPQALRAVSETAVRRLVEAPEAFRDVVITRRLANNKHIISPLNRFHLLQ